MELLSKRMMTFAIILFSLIVFVQYIVSTNNYYLILPALIFLVVILLLISTIPENKENKSSSVAGVITIPTNNVSKKADTIDEVETTIPDPIQSGYDIPLM